MTHVSMRSKFGPSCWDNEESHHIPNDPFFEVEHIFG